MSEAQQFLLQMPVSLVPVAPGPPAPAPDDGGDGGGGSSDGWATNTWEAPYFVSVDNPDNGPAIQAAIDDAYGDTNRVRLPVGRLHYSGGLKLKHGLKLEGRGSGPGKTNNSQGELVVVNSGTELYLNDGSNVDGITCGKLLSADTSLPTTSQFETFHWGAVRDIRFNGNRSNNEVGSSIRVLQGGENSVIERCLVAESAEYGINFEGVNAPARVTQCSVFGSNKAALRVAGGGLGVFHADELSGDSNNTFIQIDGSSTMLVTSLKAEKKHPILFDIGGRCSLTVLGGYANATGYSDDENTIFNIRGAANQYSTPQIFMAGLMHSRYIHLVKDHVTGETVRAGGQAMGHLKYNTKDIHAGQWWR